MPKWLYRHRSLFIHTVTVGLLSIHGQALAAVGFTPSQATGVAQAQIALIEAQVNGIMTPSAVVSLASAACATGNPIKAQFERVGKLVTMVFPINQDQFSCNPDSGAPLLLQGQLQGYAPKKGLLCPYKNSSNKDVALFAVRPSDAGITVQLYADANLGTWPALPGGVTIFPSSCSWTVD